MHKARVLATCYFLNTIYRREGLSVRKELFEPWEMAKGIISREEYDMILKLSEVD
jgi:hypothetical protein